MTLYFIAGEASGDNHGAELMRSLRQCDADLNFLGRGGPQMKAIAGEQFTNWIDDAAVLGLSDVIKNYGFFREKFRETLAEIEKSKPDAVVLIDYPGFNLRLARALRRNAGSKPVRPGGITPDDAASDILTGRIDEKTSVFRRKIIKIIYYISPQVWAWHRGRIKKMARFLDLMLCIFPFEAELYNKSGLPTVFVGHPMVDRLRTGKIDSKRDPNLVGLFPGSRPREVARNFPVMLDAARELFRANATQLPNTNSRKIPAIAVSNSVPTSIVTTDFFGFDNSQNTYKLQGLGNLSEMGDAVLGAVLKPLASRAPAWVAVRNVSDPQINEPGKSLREQAHDAALIYKGFGRWSSVCSAIVCWALIV